MTSSSGPRSTPARTATTAIFATATERFSTARMHRPPRIFTLNRAEIRTGSSQVVLEGSVKDYGETPQAQVRYDAHVEMRDVGRILNDSTLPAGNVRLAGLLNYQSRRDLPALKSVRLAGTASSEELQVATNGTRTVFRNLK